MTLQVKQAYPLRICLVGVGKIARDQHIPVIQASDKFELAALVSGRPQPEFGVPVYLTLEEALAQDRSIDAVVICTPPSVRTDQATIAFDAGCAVMLEKPPAKDVATARLIRQAADSAGCVVFASWHSRFAPMVAQASGWTKERTIVSGRVVWHEDVTKWHPGQTWLWEESGFGVFDPGINALSILTHLHPLAMTVKRASYDVPENSKTPVAVSMSLASKSAEIDISFDFQAGDAETWTIELTDADGETLLLSEGGAALSIAGGEVQRKEASEYEGVYARFAEQLRSDSSDFDLSPLEIVEDANKVASSRSVSAIFN